MDTIIELAQGLEWGLMIRCAGAATMTNSSEDPSNGDSGSPVVIPTSGNNVELIGTMFAGGSSGFKFSRPGLIYCELGSSSSWDSCVSGRQSDRPNITIHSVSHIGCTEVGEVVDLRNEGSFLLPSCLSPSCLLPSWQ